MSPLSTDRIAPKFTGTRSSGWFPFSASRCGGICRRSPRSGQCPCSKLIPLITAREFLVLETGSAHEAGKSSDRVGRTNHRDSSSYLPWHDLSANCHRSLMSVLALIDRARQIYVRRRVSHYLRLIYAVC